MRTFRPWLVLLLVVLATGCSAIGLGGGPPAPPPPQLAGGWAGFLEVEGQQILGILWVNQEGRDLGVTFTSTGLIGSASGSGKIEDEGVITMNLVYTTQCKGEMVLSGGVVEARLQETLSATDCTGNARGGFTFSRR